MHIIVLCLSSFAYAQMSGQVLPAMVQTPADNTHTQHTTSAAKSNASLLDLPYVAIFSAIKNIKGLNYYTAKGITFEIPGTKQEVALDWGFKGSGNIFTPLPTIQTQIRQITSKKASPEKQQILQDLIYIAIQNKALHTIKDAPILQWVTQASKNPLALVGLKLALLIKTSLEDTSRSHNNMYAEIMRLLFRLNLSVENGLLDKECPLSSMIPEDLKLAAEIQIPGCMEFINELWVQITSTAPIAQNTKYYTISCFAFHDKEFAEQVEQWVNKYKGQQLISCLTQLVNQNGRQVVSFENFTVFPEAQELVGLVSTSRLDNANLPKCVQTAINSATQFPMAKLIAAENGEYWLCTASDKLEAIDTAKAIILSFARTLHDYIALKKELFTSQTPEGRAYRKQWEEDELKRETIQNFLETEEGMASFARLSQEINEIMQPVKSQKQIQIRKEECFQAIQSLEKQRDALTSEIELREILKKSCKGKELATIQARLQVMKNQLEVIDGSITEKQKQLASLEIAATPAVAIEKDKETLARLEKQLAAKQNKGEVPSEKLVSAIQKLQEKINSAAAKPQVIDTDQRLEKRAQVAKAITKEAIILEKQLFGKNEKIQQIADENERTAEEFDFDSIKEGYTTYIQHLKKEALRIIDQNQKANDLKRYKKAAASVGIATLTKERQETIKALEEQVGQLLTTAKEENFIQSIQGTRSELNDFIADLQGNNEAFKNIKETLIETLANSLKNSEHIQNNITLYQHIINTFIPSLFPMLSPLTQHLA